MKFKSLSRCDIAKELTQILKDEDVVNKAGIRGSIANKNADRFSDIDLFVTSDSAFDCDLVDRITRRVCARYDLLFSDWARSLLPATRLVSYYMKDLPIYWNIDIEFSVPDDRKTISKDAIIHHKEEHCLKLWCLTLKHIHRGNDLYNDEVPMLYRRVLGESNTNGKSYSLLMKEILDSLSGQLPLKFMPFLSECEKELTLVL